MSQEPACKLDKVCHLNHYQVTRCCVALISANDLIAEGIIQALQQVDVQLPVVVRLEGTNVDKGKALLAGCGLSILTADGLTDAAEKVVAAARGGQA